MRKVIRIAFFTLLVLGGTAVICWFVLMRRELPMSAQYIPKNVIAVLTLNMRELALDYIPENHLFPENEKRNLLEKELKQIKKVFEETDNAGLSATNDVLGFFFLDGESAFAGICVSLKDSADFGKVMRTKLSEKFSFNALKGAMFRLDTSSAVVGWNKDAALFIFPISNEDVLTTSAQCQKLLSLSKEKSVLTDENFCAHELSSFDAGLWIQPVELLKFSKGGSLMSSAFENIKYLSLAMDFQDGELIMRRSITQLEKKENVPYNGEVLVTCDPLQVRGFFHTALELQNDTSLNNNAFDHLPFTKAQKKQLAELMDGNYTLLVHDNFKYEMEFVTYEYDADFNQVPVTGKKTVESRGLTANFGLNNKANVEKVITEWMSADSIPKTGNTWTIGEGEPYKYLILTDNILTVTNWKQVDGKKRKVPFAWDGLDLFLPIDKIVIPEIGEMLSFFLPGFEKNEKLLTDNFENILVSDPLVIGDTRTSQVRITMKNKKVNALVQWEEIMGKMMNGN